MLNSFPLYFLCWMRGGYCRHTQSENEFHVVCNRLNTLAFAEITIQPFGHFGNNCVSKFNYTQLNRIKYFSLWCNICGFTRSLRDHMQFNFQMDFHVANLVAGPMVSVDTAIQAWNIFKFLILALYSHSYIVCQNLINCNVMMSLVLS